MHLSLTRGKASKIIEAMNKKIYGKIMLLQLLKQLLLELADCNNWPPEMTQSYLQFNEFFSSYVELDYYVPQTLLHIQSS